MTINSLHFLSRYFPIPTRLYIPAASHMPNVQPYRCGKYTPVQIWLPRPILVAPALGFSICMPNLPPPCRAFHAVHPINRVAGTLQVPTTFYTAFSPAPTDVKLCGLDIRILGINLPPPCDLIRLPSHTFDHSTQLVQWGTLFPPPADIEPTHFNIQILAINPSPPHDLVRHPQHTCNHSARSIRWCSPTHPANCFRPPPILSLWASIFSFWGQNTL
jgi:hypothetical protein